MTFVHGRSAVLLVDQYDLSAYLSSTDWTDSVDIPATTTLGNVAARRQVVGARDGSVSLAGYYDSAAGGSHPVLSTMRAGTNPSVITEFPELSTIGLPAQMVYAREKSLKEGSKVDGVTPISVDLDADDGVDHGVSLHALAAVTATGGSASVDNAASSANGGIGHVHCTSVSAGGDTLDVKLQHSVNDADWVDLTPAFAQLAAAGKERITIAAGTTINRYLREYHTVAGADVSIVYAVAFARR